MGMPGISTLGYKKHKGNRMSKHTPRLAENLNFIQSMLLQLNQMALSERQNMLAYLIEMAYIECGDRIRAEHGTSLPIEEYQRNSAA
jgi:hypothetical protein